MEIQCCPVCRGGGLHPDDSQLERVKEMRLCPACDGLGETSREQPQEYPKSLQLYIVAHLRRHAESR